MLRIQVLVALVLCLGVTPFHLGAAEDKSNDKGSAALPPFAVKALQSFPADTETLIVAQSFNLVAASERGTLSYDLHDAKSCLSQFAFRPLISLGDGQFLALLHDLQGDIAILGGRSYETVSAFGTQRFEACAMIKFKDDLGPTGEKLIERAQEQASKRETIGERVMYVFAPDEAAKSRQKPAEWEADCLALLAPDTLVVGTSPRYMKDFLARYDASPADRALPNDLPEWKHLDPRASWCLLRHLPDTAQYRSSVATGLVINYIAGDESKIDFIYLPRDPQKCAEYATRQWPSRLGFAPTAERLPDDAVKLSLSNREITSTKGMWLLFLIEWSQGDRFAPARHAPGDKADAPQRAR